MAELMTQTSNVSYFSSPNPLLDKPYKSGCFLFFVTINACISAFYVGYSLVYISTFLSFQTITQIYNIQIGSLDVTQSLVTACVPIGAIFGALSTSLLLKTFSRKNTFLFANGIVCLSCVLLFFQYAFMIVIGRLFQGVCVGIFSAIVPLYINEFVPKQLKNFGALNQFFIAFAQSFAFLWYFILTEGFDLSDQQSWRYMVYFTFVTTLIQTLAFVFLFPYQTPKYWFSIGNQQKGKQLIKIIYHQVFIQEVIDQLILNDQKNIIKRSAQLNSKSQIQKKGIQPEVYRMPTICIFMAIHVALYQQLTGVNSVALYGGKIVNQALPSLNKIIPILTNLLPAIAAAFTIPLMKKYGRITLLQIGGICLVISLLIMSIAFLVKDQTESIIPKLLIIIFMFVYMGSFGLTLGPIVWLYIPQIVQANIIPYSTMANLIGASVCVILFPIASAQLPNQAYLFIIFMIWGVASLVINKFYLVQTKQKPRQQVYREFSKIQEKLFKKE